MKLWFACGISSLLLLGLYLAISTQPASGGHIIGQPVAVTDRARVREILNLYREKIENEIKASGKIRFGNWGKVTEQKVQGVIYYFGNLDIYDTACERNGIDDEEDECFQKKTYFRVCDVKVYDSNGVGMQEPSKIKVTTPNGCFPMAGWDGHGINPNA